MNGSDAGRRRFLSLASSTVKAAAAVAWIPGWAGALEPLLGVRPRSKVAVFGGGVAGMTAAHELALRGFDVTIYERRIWGGKCWSTQVPGSATDGRKPLPGEHAYRVPFGFYQNLPDTMRRIPFESNRNGVFDNLTSQPQGVFARAGRGDIVLPVPNISDPGFITTSQALDTVIALGVELQLPPDVVAHFAQRMVVFFSSCEARRTTQWDEVSWYDFIGADRFNEDYRRTLAALPQFTQASKAKDTCAEYIARFLDLSVANLAGRGSNGTWLRILNRPTQEAWINPWVDELSRLGVRMRLGWELIGLRHSGGRIGGATVRSITGKTEAVAADWYTCAMPVEVTRKFFGSELRSIDPALAGLDRLGTDWMNGISYFLREPIVGLNGLAACFDSPWAVSGQPQGRFWNVDFAATYGDGQVHDKLSVAIADWGTPGRLYGKPARECSPDEVATEAWEDFKRHVNKPGTRPVLTDAMLHSYEIDPGMLREGGRLISGDPLVLPTKGTRRFRPDAGSRVPNLALCGDYLSGPWIITTMESANESGRRAANVILERSNSHDAKVPVIPPFAAPEFRPLQKIDALRHALGQRNLFDVELGRDGVRKLLSSIGG